MEKVLKNKGKSLKLTTLAFTLIELIATIIILGVIALITFPVVDKVIENSRQQALERTIENIKKAAYSYSIEYDLGYSAEQKILELSELINKGFISDEEHLNPVTNKELQGCIIYTWDESKKQYRFEYKDLCKIEGEKPTITLVYDEDYINENGWINQNIMININGTGNKYYYCLSDSRCNPTIEENKSNGSQIITTEGTNVVCAKAVNNFGESEVVCTEELNIDKTKPIVGEITIKGTLGENNWYTSDVSISAAVGSDSLSGYDQTIISKENITSNTLGTMIYVVTKDLAGNSETKAINVKIDKNSPNISPKTGNVQIIQGTSNPTSNYFNVLYSISGGNISCIPDNTVNLIAGETTINCTAIGNNGLQSSATKIINVINNEYTISVNNVTGVTVDVDSSATSGSVVTFSTSVTNNDWDTYSYLGMNIKSLNGDIIQTLKNNQFVFEMPNKNIILEPIVEKSGIYVVKNGEVNFQIINNYSASLQSKTYISHNTKYDSERTTVSGNNKNNIGTIDVTGFSYVDAEFSVSYSHTGNIWSYTGTSSVLLGTKTLYSHSSDVTNFTIPITNFDISSLTGMQTISLSTNLRYTCTNWWYDQNTTGTVVISVKNFYLHN